MIYPGYVPREGIEPILLHYGLPFSVGNWSFSKLDHHEDDIVYNCGKLFPAPPYPREVCGQMIVVLFSMVNCLCQRNLSSLSVLYILCLISISY